MEAAINAGATTVNIPDTVGYTTPYQFGGIISELFNRVPNIDKTIISVHCHDDLGMSVANSITAVQAGARQIEGTINGLGERAGNCALEEVIMAIKVREKCWACARDQSQRDLPHQPAGQSVMQHRYRRTRPWSAAMPSPTPQVFTRTA